MHPPTGRESGCTRTVKDGPAGVRRGHAACHRSACLHLLHVLDRARACQWLLQVAHAHLRLASTLGPRTECPRSLKVDEISLPAGGYVRMY